MDRRPENELPSDPWLARRRIWVVAAIAVLSVLVRAIYFAELAGGPMLELHRSDQLDTGFFHAWACVVADGDVLTDRPLHPHHAWHRRFAEEHFASHPADRAELELAAQAEGRGRTAGELLWDRWYGGKQFHQEPLYPYAIAATYAALGRDPRWVFAWQMALGIASNLLVYALARKLFGDTAGALAGALASLCAVLVHYELLLLRATLLVLFQLALAWTATLAFERGSARRWLAFGAVAGLALLLKTTFALHVLAIFLLLAWRQRADVGALARSLVPAVAAIGLCLLPAVLRNVAVGAPALSLSSVGPIGVMSALAEDTVGPWSFSIGSRHTPEVFGRTGGVFLPVLIETLETNASAWTFLGPLGGRFLGIWHWFEIPNNASLYYFELHAPVLRWLPVGFGLIAPLGLVGLALTARDARARPLALCVLANVPTLVLFGVVARYRLPMAAAMIPFAALTVVRIASWARARRWGRATAALVPSLLLAAFVERHVSAAYDPIRPIDCGTPYAIHYEPLAREAERHGDWSRAARVIGESLAFEPPLVRELGAARPARTGNESELARLFSRVRQLHGFYLSKAGSAGEAQRELARADELARAAERGR